MGRGRRGGHPQTTSGAPRAVPPEWTKLSLKAGYERKKNNSEDRYCVTRLGAGNHYVLTTQVVAAAWQNGHCHSIREWYAVQKGWVALATLDADRKKVVLHRFEVGGAFVTNPLEPHNIFLDLGAELHTVKFGHGSTNWHGSPTRDPDPTKCSFGCKVLDPASRQVLREDLVKLVATDAFLHRPA